MHIAHITSECAPFAKVGGLADVIIGLSKELVRQGHSVDVLIPHYPFAEHHLPPVTLLDDPFFFNFGDEHVNVKISKTIYEGIGIYLIDLDSPSHFFHRDRIYGYEDDDRRFLVFLKAAIEFMDRLKKSFPIVHLHDWPTAAAPILFDEVKRTMSRPSFVLTVHNLSYQGVTSYRPLEEAGIFSQKACKLLEDLYIPYRFNLLLGGLRSVDHITTVSPTYAQEISTVELGKGLHEIFIKRAKQFTGILNGLDPVEIERYIEIPNSVKSRDFDSVIHLKKGMKEKLTRELGIDAKAPYWMISVTRLADQKAPHLILEAAKDVLARQGVFILVGSDGDHHIRKMFLDLQDTWAHTNRVHVFLGYNPKLAEQLFAAADFCIIPSYFEPCGLTQLISFYFATIPIVRKTGGLNDTVFDEESKTGFPNGYTFQDPDLKALNGAVDRALNEFGTNKYLMRQKNGVKTDISWKNSALKYVVIYKEILR
ncbi:MAG: glycogen synthase [Chlamydiae bacterium]|nr:glycogen synthase [Chlamydiota bacterium]